MKNQKEIYAALASGKTIVNLSGDEVFLKEDGNMNGLWHFGNPEIWSIKPEIYEFECEWENIGELGCIAFRNNPIAKKLVGKKTKVRVEVIDEN